MATRLSIPIEALTSRLNLGGHFDGVRSQSLASRFTNLRPISEFFDVKRISKPSGFGEIQSRVNYNLGYFQSNYFTVAVMLAIYSLITNPALLFDMVFMGLGLFAIRRLGGRDLNLGFTTLTTSQLYTTIFVIGIPVFIWASPIATALWLIGAIGVTVLGHASFFRGGGLGGRPRTPYDSPFWGRPAGARARRGEHFHNEQNKKRFEEITSSEEDYSGSEPDYDIADEHEFDDEQDDEGVALRLEALPRILEQTGRKGERRVGYRHTESDIDELAMEDDDSHTQIVLRGKEEYLVKKALMRIRRAQELGEQNVKLTKLELEALQRQNERDAALAKSSTKSRSGSSSKRNMPNKEKKESRLSQLQSRLPGRRVRPGESTTGFPFFLPVGYRPPAALPYKSINARPSSRSGSSLSLARTSSREQKSHRDSGQRNSGAQSPRLSVRSLPDDPNWMPRPRSSSSSLAASSIHKHSYDTNSPYTYSHSQLQHVHGRSAKSVPQSPSASRFSIDSSRSSSHQTRDRQQQEPESRKHVRSRRSKNISSTESSSSASSSESDGSSDSDSSSLDVRSSMPPRLPIVDSDNSDDDTSDGHGVQVNMDNSRSRSSTLQSPSSTPTSAGPSGSNTHSRRQGRAKGKSRR